MRARHRKKLSKRPRLIGRCPECRGEVQALPKPYLCAISHAAGCSLNNADNGYLSPTLRSVLLPAEVKPDGL